MKVIRVESTDYPKLLKQIRGALKSTIDAHGPIDARLLDSGAKRVLKQLTAYEREANKYERARQLKRRAMMIFE